jgi:alkylation response protein AidB-like acyl-CoA dehydrogenase
MNLYQGLSEEKRKSLEVAESARETEWVKPSFVAKMFQGSFQWDMLLPFPEQSEADQKTGDAFLKKLESFLKSDLDPDEVDRTGIIPDKVYKGLAAIGAFAMKIPKAYGGLGLSQTNYNRAVGMVASLCGSTAVLLSAHQSIGVPQPLILFGTDQQKKKYLPRFSKDPYISAFALTEIDVGSDPAKMTTEAKLSDDGKHYVLNGLKLWCTNGTIADIFIVMARTPDREIKGKKRKQITAFIVEKSMPGVKVEHRCRFMGLNGIQNGLIRFDQVKVPKENILWGEGLGLKLALVTLNTGRLTVPAATMCMAKRCLTFVRTWSKQRSQWGQAIGKHEAIASKIAHMAAMTFAMESVTWMVSAMADDKKADLRLEAAMSKLFCTEAAWRIADDTVQIRGGRGYETADSLKARGEEAIPAERILRDARINLIIEGTSEIMHLFIAREAMDMHLRLAGPLLDPKTSLGTKLTTAIKAGFFYLTWYPRLHLFPSWVTKKGVPRKLHAHLNYVEKNSRRLARNLFHAMLFFRENLEKKQQVMFRLVNIGTDLFAMASGISHAALKVKRGQSSASELCDLFCRLAEARIEGEFDQLFCNEDAQIYKVGRGVFEGRYEWLEKGSFDNL